MTNLYLETGGLEGGRGDGALDTSAHRELGEVEAAALGTAKDEDLISHGEEGDQALW